MAFTQVNGILHIAITGGEVSVLIQGEQFSWNDGTIQIQWYEITVNGNGVWNKNPANPNSQVAQLTANLAASNSYRALSNANQIAQVTTFLQNYYNNKIGLAQGTIQPVLT
jgi:hypothetical protein